MPDNSQLGLVGSNEEEEAGDARNQAEVREPPGHVRAVAPEEAVGGYAAGRRCGQSKEVSLGNSLDQ